MMMTINREPSIEEKIFSFFLCHKLETITLVYHGSGDSGGVEDYQSYPELPKEVFNDEVKEMLEGFFYSRFSFHVDDLGSEGQAVFCINDDGEFVMDCSNNYFEESTKETVRVSVDQFPARLQKALSFLLPMFTLTDCHSIEFHLQGGWLDRESLVENYSTLDEKQSKAIELMVRYIQKNFSLEDDYAEFSVKVNGITNTVDIVVDENTTELTDQGEPSEVTIMGVEEVEEFKTSFETLKKAA